MKFVSLLVACICVSYIPIVSKIIISLITFYVFILYIVNYKTEAKDCNSISIV